MRPMAAARRYAHAAFQVAREEGDPQRWLDQMQPLGQVMSDDELRTVMKNPNISDAEKVGVWQHMFPDLHPEILNMIRLLIARRRIQILPAVATAFEDELNTYLGRTEAEVVSARPLSTDERALVQERLRSMTGQTVQMRTAVDPALIGGLVIRIGDRLIDGSVATRLERLRQTLA